MKVVIRNVRGLNSHSKELKHKNLISNYYTDFVILSETEHQNVKNLCGAIYISITWIFIKTLGSLWAYKIDFHKMGGSQQFMGLQKETIYQIFGLNLRSLNKLPTKLDPGRRLG